jgi:hypothetical protein
MLGLTKKLYSDKYCLIVLLRDVTNKTIKENDDMVNHSKTNFPWSRKEFNKERKYFSNIQYLVITNHGREVLSIFGQSL